MKEKILFFCLAVLILSCAKQQYYQQEIDNPVFKPNTVFTSFEDLASPKFKHLREKYKLDTVFHGETNEFKRILLLRDWIKSNIEINDYGDPYPGKGFAEGILDAAIEGQGFHCGHFMTVQNAIMNAYGYLSRPLGAGPGIEGGPDGHHGVNEVWSNDFSKWFLCDAKYNHHFEKDGIPQSALEIREEYMKNKAKDLLLIKGISRQSIDQELEYGIDGNEMLRSKEGFAQIYTWVAWNGFSNYFTTWPDFKDMIVMYDDDFYKNNFWFHSGKKHWTYRQPQFLKLVENRGIIEWTPNTISSQVTIEDKNAIIKLRSDTPNFKEYQMKKSLDSEWKKVDNRIDLELSNPSHQFHFRTVNLAGVTGPVHKLLFKNK